jgi:hypothetical protein
MKKLLAAKDAKALEQMFKDARDSRDDWLSKTWAGRRPGTGT